MKKFVAVIIAVLAIMTVVLGAEIKYKDLVSNHWAYDAVSKMTEKEILKGYPDGTFLPSKEITRAEFSKILVLCLNLKNENSKTYDDVPSSHWANKFIKVASNYLNNYEKSFKPDDSAIREEVAAAVIKALGLQDESVDENILNKFSDKSNISNDYKDLISIAVKNEIMNGNTDGTFNPKGAITRAEVSQLMFNVLKDIETKKIKYKNEYNEVDSSGDSIINSSGDNKMCTFSLLKYMPKNVNYMFSPFSLKMAMMLAANGANGNTQNEIINAFGINNINEYNKYAKELISKYNTNEFVKLNVANSIWLNKTIAENIDFKDDYKKIVKDFYEGEASAVEKSKIVSTVNNWISDKTNNKIKNVLSEANSGALSFLVNTIYFKGEWANEFEKDATYKDEFTDRNGNKTQIDFMHKTAKYGYYEDENMKMVRLPYKGHETSMYVILPNNEDKMDISKAIENMNYSYKIRLSLPKFKTEYTFSSLKSMLNNMGIELAFKKDSADFTNMFGSKVAYIDDVIQKTFIEVEEKGTEAAAATVVIVNATSALPVEEIIKDFKADKPFIYFIMDENTKEVLFMGEYAYTK